MRLMVFCEGAADYDTVSLLLDRVLVEEGPGWVADLSESLDSVRQWHPDGAAPFFDIHRLAAYAGERGVRPLHGAFDGRRGAHGALMALTAFLIARQERHEGEPVDVVVLCWDMDGAGDERRSGLNQARTKAHEWFRGIVLACPDRMREAWVLAGVEPKGAEESRRLGEISRSLGFDPREDAHRLQDPDQAGTRNPKRVLGDLLQHDRHRERAGLSETKLSELRRRGHGSGLQALLDEASTVLHRVASEA